MAQSDKQSVGQKVQPKPYAAASADGTVLHDGCNDALVRIARLLARQAAREFLAYIQEAEPDDNA